MFLRNIFESIQRTGQGKTAVIGWGRGMGHKGHMMLASSVITQAGKVGGDPYFVVSKTVGKDDPITPDEKIAIYKKVFPQSGHIFQPATDEIPDLTRVLANLNQQGYTSVTVVLGADQVKAFQYLKNYNNKPDKSGNILYSFDNLDVISRQETGDPSAGEEGPRATPMRQVLMDPTKSEQEQFAVWRDAMSPEVSDDEVRDLMMKAKERMTAMNAPKPKKAKATSEAVEEEPGQHRVAVKITDPETYDDVQRIVRVHAKDKREAVEKAEEYYTKRDIYVVNVKYIGMVGQGVAEGASDAMASTASRLANKDDGKVAKLRAAGDKRRDSHYMGTQIAKNDRTSKDEWGNLKKENFNGEYDDEAGMAQSNLRTMARAVDGLLKTIKNNDNLPEWGQEKIAKAEMMLVSIWDYLQSQKELGMDPKVNMAEATSAAIRLQRAIERQRAKSDASLRRTPSSIPKPEPKKDEKVAELRAVEPDPTGYQKDLLTSPKNALVVDTPGDLDWYKLGQHYPTLDKDDPHEYGQGDSDMVIVPYSEKELAGLTQKLDRLKMRYKNIGGGHEQPEIHDKVEEKMLPKSAFAGSDKNELGHAAHATGKQKGPVKRGQFVGGMEEEKQRLDPSCWKGYRKSGTKMKGGVRVNNCVPVSEGVEDIMDSLINKIITNEAIQNNRK